MKKEMIQVKDGCRAVYFGPINGNPQLFCIHGGMGLDSNSLIPYFGKLSEIFDLVFIDLRGHGESESAKSNKYDFQDFSDDVIQIVQKLKHNELCGVFGHSLGGMVAVQAISDDTDIFNFAIITNSAIDSTWLKHSELALAKLDQQKLQLASENYDKNPEAESLKKLAIAYGPLYFPELSTDFAEKKMAEFTYNDVANSYLSELVYPSMNLTNEAEKLVVPTLVISGELDWIVPVECQKNLATKLKNSVHEIILSAGHFPFVTKTNSFNQVVSNWWDKTRSRAR